MLLPLTVLGCDSQTYTPKNQCESYQGKAFVSLYQDPMRTNLSPYEDDQAQRHVGYIFTEKNTYNRAKNTIERLQKEILAENKKVQEVDSSEANSDSLEAVIDSLSFEKQRSEYAINDVLASAYQGSVVFPENRDLENAVSLHPYNGERGSVECIVEER